MKVLHVASWYPRDSSDIAGVFVRDHIRCLAPNVEQLVVVPAADARGTVQDEEGLRVSRPRVPSLRGPWLLPYIASVWREARRLGPNLIHGHVARPGGVAALWAARRLGVPMVLTEHVNPFRSLLATHPLNRAVACWAVRGAAVCTAVSRYHAASIRAAIPTADPIVVPNAVETSRFQPRSPSVDGRVRLLYVGRLDKNKGCDILLAALRSPAVQNVSWSLTVAGGGPEETALRPQGATLEHVHFLGHQPPAAIPSLLSRADILVLPSRSESFGVVLVEALAAGVPVLATRCGGPEDIVLDEVGRLVAPDSVPALAEGLAWMLSHHATFVPAKLHAYAEKHFGFATVTQLLMEVYRRALAQHAVRA